MTGQRRTALIAAVAVLAVSIVARLLASSFSLYLEPWAVMKQGHVWQLVTWIPSGASLTFVLDAALLGYALSQGGSVNRWLGTTLIVGVLVTLLSFVIPALSSCTFTGAGVGAAACLFALSRGTGGKQRWLFVALALVPAVLDAAVDGSYTLLPYALAWPVATGWVRFTRART